MIAPRRQISLSVPTARELACTSWTKSRCTANPRVCVCCQYTAPKAKRGGGATIQVHGWQNIIYSNTRNNSLGLQSSVQCPDRSGPREENVQGSHCGAVTNMWERPAHAYQRAHQCSEQIGGTSTAHIQQQLSGIQRCQISPLQRNGGRSTFVRSAY